MAHAYLPTAKVTITMVEMIMSLVLEHENKKLIWRPLNLVHEVGFNENEKALDCLIATLGYILDSQLSWESGKFQLKIRQYYDHYIYKKNVILQICFT